MLHWMIKHLRTLSVSLESYTADLVLDPLFYEYVERGKLKKAKSMIARTRKLYPNDLQWIRAEMLIRKAELNREDKA